MNRHYSGLFDFAERSWNGYLDVIEYRNCHLRRNPETVAQLVGERHRHTECRRGLFLSSIEENPASLVVVGYNAVGDCVLDIVLRDYEMPSAPDN